mmetsp:Transcript_10060/g.33242  ORF Transcript_10060/g.33242 Transcript_10060/m.33242 type:complete len:226 (+) Transcript_10060:228-905(+)
MSLCASALSSTRGVARATPSSPSASSPRPRTTIGARQCVPRGSVPRAPTVISASSSRCSRAVSFLEDCCSRCIRNATSSPSISQSRTSAPSTRLSPSSSGALPPATPGTCCAATMTSTCASARRSRWCMGRGRRRGSTRASFSRACASRASRRCRNHRRAPTPQIGFKRPRRGLLGGRRTLRTNIRRLRKATLTSSQGTSLSQWPAPPTAPSATPRSCRTTCSWA